MIFVRGFASSLENSFLIIEGRSQGSVDFLFFNLNSFFATVDSTVDSY